MILFRTIFQTEEVKSLSIFFAVAHLLEFCMFQSMRRCEMASFWFFSCWNFIWNVFHIHLFHFSMSFHYSFQFFSLILILYFLHFNLPDCVSLSFQMRPIWMARNICFLLSLSAIHAHATAHPRIARVWTCVWAVEQRSFWTNKVLLL